jgi:hypothetical protein
VFVDPDVLRPSDGRGRQARSILAKQGGQRRREVAARHAFQVEDRDQCIEALRTPGVGRQDCRREADARRIVGARLPVAHARLAHGHRPDAGQDLALGQMPVPHDAPAAVVGLQIGARGQKLGHFRFDRLGQKRPRAIAQNLAQPVGQNPWLNQFDNVIVGHGISLLRWRSGGSNTPTICRLPRFTPSPTFGNSS